MFIQYELYFFTNFLNIDKERLSKQFKACLSTFLLRRKALVKPAASWLILCSYRKFNQNSYGNSKWTDNSNGSWNLLNAVVTQQMFAPCFTCLLVAYFCSCSGEKTKGQINKKLNMRNFNMLSVIYFSFFLVCCSFKVTYKSMQSHTRFKSREMICNCPSQKTIENWMLPVVKYRKWIIRHAVVCCVMCA